MLVYITNVIFSFYQYTFGISIKAIGWWPGRTLEPVVCPTILARVVGSQGRYIQVQLCDPRLKSGLYISSWHGLLFAVAFLYCWHDMETKKTSVADVHFTTTKTYECFLITPAVPKLIAPDFQPSGATYFSETLMFADAMANMTTDVVFFFEVDHFVPELTMSQFINHQS